jgi:Fic family protein
MATKNTPVTRAKEQFAAAQIPATAQECQSRIEYLGRYIEANAALAKQLELMRKAAEIVASCEAEIEAIHAALPGIQHTEREAEIGKYNITGIRLVNGDNALRKYHIEGTYNGEVLERQPLNNSNRILIDAIVRKPELIPADVLDRDPDVLRALEKHFQDHQRGYISN